MVLKENTMPHRAGFVNIIGRPNAGKSTLMNLLVGEKLSIITPKAQTTRHRILGILNKEDFQIVFSDTPGILDPAYRMHNSMMTTVYGALSDADVLIYLVDLMSEPNEAEEKIIEKVNLAKIPVLLVLNKTDLLNETQIAEKEKKWIALMPAAERFNISALKAVQTDKLLERIVALLPEHNAYYDKDVITDRNMRFIVSEIIREKILMNYRQEIPYSVHIEITTFKEETKLVRIHAIIHVERDSQKGIIIGDKGKSIKKVGIEARQDIEKWLERQVYLELNVKVSKDWRENENRLRSFGYDS